MPIRVLLVGADEREAAQTVIRAGLSAFNARYAPPSDGAALVLVARDSAGEIVGGLTGNTTFAATGRGWFHIDALWVADAWRGRGVGRQLLRDAEEEAARRGCRHAHLETIAFQARPFYEREGYTVFATLEDLPPGSRLFFMRKPLRLPSERAGSGAPTASTH